MRLVREDRGFHVYRAIEAAKHELSRQRREPRALPRRRLRARHGGRAPRLRERGSPTSSSASRRASTTRSRGRRRRRAHRPRLPDRRLRAGAGGARTSSSAASAHEKLRGGEELTSVASGLALRACLAVACGSHAERVAGRERASAVAESRATRNLRVAHPTRSRAGHTMNTTPRSRTLAARCAAFVCSSLRSPPLHARRSRSPRSSTTPPDPTTASSGSSCVNESDAPVELARLQPRLGRLELSVGHASRSRASSRPATSSSSAVR